MGIYNRGVYNYAPSILRENIYLFIYLQYIIHSKSKLVSLKVEFFINGVIKALRSISKRWFFIPLFSKL